MDWIRLALDWIFRDSEMERRAAEQKETLVKELDFSSEKGKEEMARLKEGMAELLDERVGADEIIKFYSQFC